MRKGEERSTACERKRQREASEAAAEKENAAAGLLVAHEQAETADRTDESNDTAFARRPFETRAEPTFDEEFRVQSLFYLSTRQDEEPTVFINHMFESSGRGAMLQLS